MSSNDQTSMFRPCVRKRDRFGQPVAPEKDMPAPLKELVTYAFRSACFKEAGAMPASRALSARAVIRRPPPQTYLYLDMHTHTRARTHTQSSSLPVVCLSLSFSRSFFLSVLSPAHPPCSLSQNFRWWS